ncbi:ABC transporter ATP-binding protein [Christensenella tenuis]|uniref:Sn-glycerol-3-phosphate ABC transporter ATP-binding protein UgpC n=1 Tax=Christensenella tenuis TaxID=2763033 RepID=A0ABR7EJK4_9FIRM|nr:sn-glycerol-3-phosphate ABC transporter ATP-binding protein UgpC [Christensenella tenuis]MBC5649348.1 sn-glycerol-3-phosphate ABC transporter ATP-binding protein UgpC [Christensenella tenuis]
MSGVVLKNIQKVYAGDVVAVDHFNMEIGDDEFVVLVGPSGCGKSTTLRMIAGIEEISDGELYIDGKLVNEVQPKDRDIAMVFQSYALYPHMSVADNMAFSLKLRKLPKQEIKQRVEQAAQILDISHLLSRKPKALSGGQRQRVALGRAIVRNPKVFLLDEPLSNLDAKLRVQMRTEIIKLYHKLKTTFIYVTHDQTEAMTMGTRIVVMKDGIIQQVGSPQEVYNEPNNIFVATFIGSPQMNLISCVLQEENNVYYAVTEKDRIKLGQRYQDCTALREYLGKEIVMGIRAENIMASGQDTEEREDSSVEAFLEVTEMLGAETFLYLNYGGEKLIAKVPPESAKQCGETIRIAFDTEKLYFFDRETELRIEC